MRSAPARNDPTGLDRTQCKRGDGAEQEGAGIRQKSRRRFDIRADRIPEREMSARPNDASGDRESQILPEGIAARSGQQIGDRAQVRQTD